MRFLVDECTGPALAQWLREHGHDVFSVYDEARGMDDPDVVQKANLDKPEPTRQMPSEDSCLVCKDLTG